MRTAWLQQNSLTFTVDDPPIGLVRYSTEDSIRDGGDVETVFLPTFECQWQELRSPERRLRYKGGPGGASLEEALAWAEASACARVMVAIGEELFTTGSSPAKDAPALPASVSGLPGLDPRRPVVLGAERTWRARYRVQLEPCDFDLARPRFAETLLHDPEVVHLLATEDDPRLGTLDATFVVSAPVEAMARRRGVAAGVRAVTAHEDGLLDYTNGRLNLFELCAD